MRDSDIPTRLRKRRKGKPVSKSGLDRQHQDPVDQPVCGEEWVDNSIAPAAAISTAASAESVRIADNNLSARSATDRIVCIDKHVKKLLIDLSEKREYRVTGQTPRGYWREWKLRVTGDGGLTLE